MAQCRSADDLRFRVTILARSLETGGAETQLVSLAKGLDPNEFRVSVACLYARGTLLQELKEAGILVLPLQKSGRWDLLRFIPRLILGLRELRPQVIHSFLGPPNIFAAFAKPWLSECHIIWGIRASNMDLSRYDWSWRLTRYLERLLSWNVDKIISNSYAGKDTAIDYGLPGTSILVIPNGIDTSKFVPAGHHREKLRKQWKIPLDAYVIGNIARLDPMKGHFSFLKAAVHAVQACPGLKFVCVGDGPADYVKTLRNRASELGLDSKIFWVGFQKDMVAVYNAVDSTTLTSDFGEGFPNSVGEAMACGRACVVTDVGDAALIIGDTGIGVPKGNIPMISDAWHTLATEPMWKRYERESLARERICRLYSQSAMIKAHSALYREIRNGELKGQV